MREVKSIEIRPVNELTELDSISQRLKALVLTRQGTLPGSRGFGLDQGFLDLGSGEAINLLALELSEKAEIYVPEIKIAEVEAEDDGTGGVKAKIYVERGDE